MKLIEVKLTVGYLEYQYLNPDTQIENIKLILAGELNLIITCCVGRFIDKSRNMIARLVE